MLNVCLGFPPNSPLYSNPLALIPFLLIHIPQVTQVGKKRCLTTYTEHFSLIKLIAWWFIKVCIICFATWNLESGKRNLSKPQRISFYKKFEDVYSPFSRLTLVWYKVSKYSFNFIDLKGDTLLFFLVFGHNHWHERSFNIEKIIFLKNWNITRINWAKAI